MRNTLTYDSGSTYVLLAMAVGAFGLSGCGAYSDVDVQESIDSSTQALTGVGDHCPSGTGYDFTYGSAKLHFCSHKNIFNTNSNVKRAIIAIRGSSWQTAGYDYYYQKTLAEAEKAGMDLDNIDIIAPRFLINDKCDNSACYWYGGACTSDADCRPAGYYRWNQYYVGGKEDASGYGVSSYEVLDALLFQLAAKRPNLEIIVVAGQSQGGIFLSHYAPSSILSSGGGITLRYWSANPASYPWLNSSRPDPTEAALCTEGVNNWTYGLDNLYQYHTSKNVDASDMINNVFTREIYWTAGENDTNGYDANAHCGNAQGQYTIDRFRNYKQHVYDECVAQNYPNCTSIKDEQFREIPGCGHGMDCTWAHPIGHKILFDTVHSNCSESAVDYEVFDSGGLNMVGCAGTVSYANRNSLCAPGYAACGASQWVNFRDGKVPHYDYWTNDPLKYGPSGGSEGNCWADETSGYSCPSSTPMRVCTENIAGLPTGTDPLGNTCNWDHCGYDGSTSNEYFGGCVGNTTAGTLCCPLPQ